MTFDSEGGIYGEGGFGVPTAPYQQQAHNPFRPGGELSREASEIVDAIRSGKDLCYIDSDAAIVCCGSSSNFGVGGHLLPPAGAAPTLAVQEACSIDTPEHELEKLVSSSDCDVVSVSRRGVEDDTTVTVTTGKVELVQVTQTPSIVEHDPNRTESVAEKVVLPDQNNKCCVIL